MILKKDETLVEVDKNIDIDESETLKIASDETEKLFEMLWGSYSNVRASIIREYVSNCFDGHEAIDSKEPVVVRIDEDESGKYIEFIDKGVGMDDEFIKKVFLNVLKSTKTKTNKFIGGKGIGSKSLLGYCNQGIITSIHNGIKRTYLLYKDNSAIPKMPLLSEEETDEHSGTSVKVHFNKGTTEIKGQYSWQTEEVEEDYLFAEECTKELCYFDNVVLEFNVNNTRIKDFQDNYNFSKIVDFKTFKYKTNCQYSKDMSLILGKVSYPINWKVLELEPINIPVGIKFEIGDFNVNMTRESIIYSDETKKLIKEKIELVKKELIDLYNNQNQPIEDILEWIKIKDREQDYNIKIDLNNSIYNLNISDLEDNLNKINFKPIEHLPIKLKRDINPFFFLKCTKYIESNRTKNLRHSLKNADRNSNFIIKNNKEVDSIEFKKYIENGYIISIDKINNRSKFREYCELLFDISNSNNRYLHDNNAVTFKSYNEDSQKFKTIIEYRNIIIQELKKVYNWIEYDSFKLPNEWIEEQKELKKLNKKKIVRLEGIIPVKNLISGKRDEFNLSKLNTYKGIILYANKETEEDMVKIIDILRDNESSYCSKYNKIDSKRLMAFSLSKENYKLFNNNPRCKNITQIMELKPLINILTSAKIQDSIVSSVSRSQIFLYNRHIQVLVNELKDFKFKHGNDNSFIVKQIITKYLGGSRNLPEIDPIIDWKLRQVEEYFKGIELMKYVNVDEQSIPYVIDFLKLKKKKVNLEFYEKGQGIRNPEITEVPFKLCEVTFKEQPLQDLTQYNKNNPKPVELCQTLN